ncbi:MAG: hypothetical protein ACFE8B_00205 [Candidatus Hermodarchaeota archaeon]
MEPKKFLEELNTVRELMTKEMYIDALKILEKLKKSDKEINQDHNYTLIHQLYQLDSNCKSALNQQLIQNYLENVLNKRKTITFRDLNRNLRDKGILDIDEDVLRKEVELLILRNRLHCRIDKETIIK